MSSSRGYDDSRRKDKQRDDDRHKEVSGGRDESRRGRDDERRRDRSRGREESSSRRDREQHRSRSREDRKRHRRDDERAREGGHHSHHRDHKDRHKHHKHHSKHRDEESRKDSRKESRKESRDGERERSTVGAGNGRTEASTSAKEKPRDKWSSDSESESPPSSTKRDVDPAPLTDPSAVAPPDSASDLHYPDEPQDQINAPQPPFQQPAIPGGALAAVAAALAEVARRQQSDVGSKEEKKKSLWANKTSQAATWQTLATSLGDTARQDKFLRLMGAKGKEAIPIAQDQDGGNASVRRDQELERQYHLGLAYNQGRKGLGSGR